MTRWVLRSAQMWSEVSATMRPLFAALRVCGQRPDAPAPVLQSDGFRTSWQIAGGGAMALLALRLALLMTAFAKDPGAPNPLLSGLCASVGTDFWPLILAAYTAALLCPLLKGKAPSGWAIRNSFRVPRQVRRPRGDPPSFRRR